MSIRAVIFDIYNTLLDVGPPPADAEERWVELWGEFLGGHPQRTLAEFGHACEKFIEKEHAAAHAAGIYRAEVLWTEAMAAAIPEFKRLSAEEQSEFMLLETGLWHTVRLMPGAAAALHFLAKRRVLLGLESNAQPYTIPELCDALDSAGLDIGIFDPSVRFLSFENGFSKPDPHVFRMLAARLRLRGIQPGEAFIVGDRMDSDIEPAKAQGFRTWHLAKDATGAHAGGWKALHKHLAAALKS